MKSIVVPKLDLKGKEFDVVVPSSKSIANRALILSALSKGSFRFMGDFDAEDIQLMIEALRKIGIHIEAVDGGLFIQNDLGWMQRDDDVELFLGNSGTSIRFLTSLVLLRLGKTTLTGKERMKQRPIHDLVNALRKAGAEMVYLEKEGFPPIQVKGLDVKSLGSIPLRGDTSSQFLTSVLLIGCGLRNGLQVMLEGELISKPYVRMTLDLMRNWGCVVDESDGEFRVYQSLLDGKDFTVEGDASAATYWWALGYLQDCVINVLNVQNDTIQGDGEFRKVLNILASSKGNFEIDMNDMPDAALTLMAVAPFHTGSVLIKNIASLRVKETDRIDAMSRELRKVGVSVEAGSDWVKVWPLQMRDFSIAPSSLLPSVPVEMTKGGKTQLIQVETYDDHRIAMSMAILATKIGNIEILDPECVHKTYPNFWKHLLRISGHKKNPA